MGKIFYASHADKEQAQRLADVAAKGYKSGVCYTPSVRIPNACSFNTETSLWTCKAAAHHHWGSCGKTEIDSNRGRGTPWEFEIPTVNWNERSPAGEAPQVSGGTPQMESYEDARPEDYVPLG